MILIISTFRDKITYKFKQGGYVYAWNEFEKGGFICPTLNADNSINDERIQVFAKLVDMWKEI